MADEAFRECRHLQAVRIPESVTRIGKWAFWRCENLTEITLPSSLAEIDKGAFCNCEKLKTLTVPSSVTHIGALAFDGCSSLKNIHFAGTVDTWQKIIKDLDLSNVYTNLPVICTDGETPYYKWST